MLKSAQYVFIHQVDNNHINSVIIMTTCLHRNIQTTIDKPRLRGSLRAWFNITLHHLLWKKYNSTSKLQTQENQKQFKGIDSFPFMKWRINFCYFITHLWRYNLRRHDGQKIVKSDLKYCSKFMTLYNSLIAQKIAFYHW